MGNRILKPLLLPASVALLWLISGWGYAALLASGNSGIPMGLAAVVSPDTMPVRIRSMLDGPGLVLVAGLSALPVAALALALLPGAKTGRQPRGTLFLASWMSMVLAAVAGSAVLAVGGILAMLPFAQVQWTFDMLAPALLTGAYWGVSWGWLPALLAVFLRASADDGGRSPAEQPSSGRQRTGALGASVLFSAALLVALPLAADYPQPAPVSEAVLTPEPAVYGVPD